PGAPAASCTSHPPLRARVHHCRHAVAAGSVALHARPRPDRSRASAAHSPPPCLRDRAGPHAVLCGPRPYSCSQRILLIVRTVLPPQLPLLPEPLPRRQLTIVDV